jgi:hypothetical protein
MSLHEVIAGAVILCTGWIGIFGIRLGLKIFFADKEEFRRNKEASPGKLDPIVGTLHTFYVGARDHRISAGLAVNKKTKKWVEQGILSESAVDTILR